MRTSNQKLSPSLKNQIIKTFAQGVNDLKDIGETHDFFRDFFTKAEVETFAKRLAVAYWLKKGRSYSNIKNNLKVSSATIAEIASTMKGEGFSTIIEKIEADEWANNWSKKIREFVGK